MFTLFSNFFTILSITYITAASSLLLISGEKNDYALYHLSRIVYSCITNRMRTAFNWLIINIIIKGRSTNSSATNPRETEHISDNFRHFLPNIDSFRNRHSFVGMLLISVCIAQNHLHSNVYSKQIAKIFRILYSLETKKQRRSKASNSMCLFFTTTVFSCCIFLLQHSFHQ